MSLLNPSAWISRAPSAHHRNVGLVGTPQRLRGPSPQSALRACARWLRGPALAVATLCQSLPALAQPVLPVATTTDIVLPGRAAERAGYEHVVGDLNADGFDDLVVAAPHGPGRIRVFFGPLTAGGLGPGAADIEIVGGGASELGWAIAAGDVDHDGNQDLVLAAPAETFGLGSLARTGAVYVFAGPLAAGSYTPSAATTTLRGAPSGGTGSFFGWELAISDLDGDGDDELVVVDTPGTFNSRSYVVAEVPAGTFTLDAAPMLSVTVLESLYGAFGTEGLAAGDFNGDGFDDLALGAPHDNFGAIDGGAVFVFYGRPSLAARYAYGPAGLDPAAIDAVLIEATEVNGNFGFSLAFTDLDLDGYADLIVGRPSLRCIFCTDDEFTLDVERPGTVFLIRGRRDRAGRPALRGTVDVSSLSESATITGGAAGDFFGRDVAPGPGLASVAIGAPGSAEAWTFTLPLGIAPPPCLPPIPVTGCSPPPPAAPYAIPLSRGKVLRDARSDSRFGFSVVAGQLDGFWGGDENLVVGAPFQLFFNDPPSPNAETRVFFGP